MFITSTFSVIRSRSLWPYFHAPVILPYIFKTISWINVILGILVLCNTTIDILTNVGHLDCISWSSDFALYLEVQVGPDKLEVVASFCYLGDMLSAAGGCELSTTTRVKTAWKKFKDLLPVLSSRHLSFKTRGHVYSSCVRNAMLHASETWPLTKPNLQRLQRNDKAMIRQICNVRPQDIVTTRSNELLVRLGIEDLDLILKERRIWWYGHVECSSGAIKTAFDILVDGKRGHRGAQNDMEAADREGLQRVEALGYQPSW